MVNNERFRNWWARFERLGTSPAGAIALARMNGQIDVRDVLSTVRVPTLVIHRDHDPRVKVAGGRYLAAHIPGAKYVEIPGTDHPIWVGDTDRVVDEIEEFLTGVRPVPEPDRVLATVLSVDVSQRAGAGRSWLDRMARFRETVGNVLRQYRGREIGQRPDGTTVVFDGPVRALNCSLAIREAAEQLDMIVRGGVHTGEVEIACEEIGGAAVHAAITIAGMARSGEILVSTTVRDIVPGSGMRFADASDRVAADETAIPRLCTRRQRRVNCWSPARRTPTMTQLSPREREVLVVVARGMTNAEIAAALDLSEHTVKRHVAKLNLANRRRLRRLPCSTDCSEPIRWSLDASKEPCVIARSRRSAISCSAHHPRIRGVGEQVVAEAG